MIAYSAIAEQQVSDLVEVYFAKSRPAALSRLIQTLREAERLIERNPDEGFDAPRPYPLLVKSGIRWQKIWHYWIAHRSDPAAIVGVYFETDDIPTRFEPG